MGLFNKLKNVLFEEEEIEIPVEEEKPKIKPKKVEAEKKPLERKRNIYESEVADDTPIVSDSSLFKAEKTFDFPVFDDQEFESMKVSTKKEEKEESKNMGINLIDYDRPKIKKEKKERTPEIRGRAYDAKTTAEIATRKFQPSPVISPVYGVLDKNYKKEDIVVVKEDKKKFDVDDARKKAFGTLEDDIEKTLAEKPKHKEPVLEEEPKKQEKVTKIEPEPEKTIDELLEETSFATIDVPEEENIEMETVETEPVELEVLDKEKKVDPKKSIEEDTLENDLFDLIDSMYEDREDE